MSTVDLENSWKQIAEQIDDAITVGLKYQKEFHNVYEAYGVLAKELHEYLSAVSGPKEERSLQYARAQLVGIAAVCVKALRSPIFEP